MYILRKVSSKVKDVMNGHESPVLRWASYMFAHPIDIILVTYKHIGVFTTPIFRQIQFTERRIHFLQEGLPLSST